MTPRPHLPIPLEEVQSVLHLPHLRPPLDWRAIYGRGGPIEIEIGAGKGLFLLAASSLRPESNFLGLEHAGKYFLCAAERLHRAERTNVRLIRHDAFDVLERWVVPGSVDVAHIYFPDPWPKQRHAKRRLLQPDLFQLLARALPASGLLCLASDVATYFEGAVRALERGGWFERIAWRTDAVDRMPTSYAVKYAQQGRSLHYAKFRRTDLAAPETVSRVDLEPGSVRVAPGEGC